MEAARDAFTDGLPVDAHVIGYCTPWEILGQPRHSQVEVFGETAAGICPRHICSNDTVLRALHTMGAVLDLHQDAAEVQCPPDFRALRRGIVTGQFAVTVWAVIQVPCIRACCHPKVLNTIVIVVESVGFNDHVIDIQRFLQ